MKEYNNNVVLITGASRGLGKATAIEFAKHKFNIVINYNNSKEQALDLQRKLEEQYGVRTLLIKCDVSDAKQVEEMKNTILQEFGRIDVLINNAGISRDSLVEDKTVESFNEVLSTNLIGPFNTMQIIGKVMYEHELGSIVNVSSNNAIDAYYPYSMEYDASKAGLISLTHNFALLYAPYTRVNAVAPGWIKTDMSAGLDQEQIAKEENDILLKRFAEPEEIAEEIFHMAVESTYMNNTVIKIDGGSY